MALNLVALPVIGGLIAATGAMGAYVVGPLSAAAPTSEPASVSAQMTEAPARPCEAQTWPYIENRCVAGTQQDRKVRLVMAPRDGISGPALPDTAAPVAPKMDAPSPAAPEQLVTRETVGRPVETAPFAAVPPVSKRVEKRRMREERKIARQAYQVPSDNRRDTRPVIVVRPLRLDVFR